MCFNYNKFEFYEVIKQIVTCLINKYINVLKYNMLANNSKINTTC